MPESAKKKKKITLGVADSKIGASIQEELGIPCQTGGVFQEIGRGKQFFFFFLSGTLSNQLHSIKTKRVEAEATLLLIFEESHLCKRRSIARMKCMKYSEHDDQAIIIAFKAVYI